jgi:hypothetical protein
MEDQPDRAMKLLRLLLTGICILTVPAAKADEKPTDKQEGSAAKTLKTTTPTGENADLTGLIVTGTMKQIIGSFSTYAYPSIGEVFAIDLKNLPGEKIEFTRSPSDPVAHAGRNLPYVPFSAPLNIERVDKREKGDGTSIILLSSRGSSSTLLIQVRAEELEKGSKVRIYLYEEVYGRIICMAEAEGFLK